MLVISLLGGGIYFFWTTTPQFTLEQIKDALKTHNLAKFEQYVDVDGVSQSIADSGTIDPLMKVTGGGALGRLVGTIGKFMTGRIAEGVADDIRKGVESGHLSAGENEGSYFSMFDRQIGLSKTKYKKLQSVTLEGDVGNAVVLTYNEKHDVDVPVKLRLRRVENHWVVTRVENFAAVVMKLMENH